MKLVSERLMGCNTGKQSSSSCSWSCSSLNDIQKLES